MSNLQPEETLKLVRRGVRLANDARADMVPNDFRKMIYDRVAALENNQSDLQQGNLNVVIFHVKIPKELSQISTPDIRNLDQGSIDYETLVNLNIQIALKTNPRSRITLITDNSFLSRLQGHKRLQVIRIKINQAEPMFERVATMLAYTKSSLFNEPTVFLDSDAFLIRPIHNIYANNFDIGVTHRRILGQMPINEGVIFANNLNADKVSLFFESYMASYIALEDSEDLVKIYPNLRRWRGGQLSINSAADGGQTYQSGIASHHNLYRIVFLPCSQYNLSQIEEAEVNFQLPKRALVLHLKGLRKSWVDRVKSVLDLP